MICAISLKGGTAAGCSEGVGARAVNLAILVNENLPEGPAQWRAGEGRWLSSAQGRTSIDHDVHVLLRHGSGMRDLLPFLLAHHLLKDALAVRQLDLLSQLKARER